MSRLLRLIIVSVLLVLTGCAVAPVSDAPLPPGSPTDTESD